MNTQRYTPEFKEEAVRQIVDRGYSVAEVSSRALHAPQVVTMVVRAQATIIYLA
jgi:transposase-like protein